MKHIFKYDAYLFISLFIHSLIQLYLYKCMYDQFVNKL